GLHELGLRFLESLQVVAELGVHTDLVERDREVMGEARENASVLIGEAAGRLIAGDQQNDPALLTAKPRHDHRANALGVEVTRAGDASVQRDVLDFESLLAVEAEPREEFGGGVRVRELGAPANSARES